MRVSYLDKDSGWTGMRAGVGKGFIGYVLGKGNHVSKGL